MLWKQPRLLGCAVREARQVESSAIRRAFGVELLRIIDHPDSAGRIAEDIIRAAYELAGQALPAPPAGYASHTAETPVPTPAEGIAQPLPNPTPNPSAGDSPTPAEGLGQGQGHPLALGKGVGAGAGAPAPTPESPPYPRGHTEPSSVPPSCSRHQRARRGCQDCAAAAQRLTLPPPCGLEPGRHGPARLAEAADGTPYPCPVCHPGGASTDSPRQLAHLGSAG